MGIWEAVLAFLCSHFPNKLKGMHDPPVKIHRPGKQDNCRARTILYWVVRFHYKGLYRPSKVLNLPFNITVPSPQGQTLTTSGISNTSSIVDRYPRIRRGRWLPTIKRYSFSSCCGVKPSLVEIRRDRISFLRQSCIRSCSDIVLQDLRGEKYFWEKVVKPWQNKTQKQASTQNKNPFNDHPWNIKTQMWVL